MKSPGVRALRDRLVDSIEHVMFVRGAGCYAAIPSPAVLSLHGNIYGTTATEEYTPCIFITVLHPIPLPSACRETQQAEQTTPNSLEISDTALLAGDLEIF